MVKASKSDLCLLRPSFTNTSPGVLVKMCKALSDVKSCLLNCHQLHPAWSKLGAPAEGMLSQSKLGTPAEGLQARSKLGAPAEGPEQAGRP